MNNRKRYKIAVKAASDGFLSNRDMKAIARYQYQVSEVTGYDTIFPSGVEVSLNNPIINVFVRRQWQYN